MTTSVKKDIKELIECLEATVSVIGLGYVGLPLAVAFAEAGFRTIGIDLDSSKVDAVNSGESYIQGISSERLAKLSSTKAKEAELLSATSDFDVLSQADAVIVCVPTPLSKTKDPDVSYIVSATDEIAKRMQPGTLVVLESTTYPGTTEEIILPRLQTANRNGKNSKPLRAGEDFYLAFSPERIDPGRTDWTVWNTPKVMGGLTTKCRDAAVALYSSALETVVPVSSPRVAETVKLLENTYRAANIALVNEFAIMCDYLGVDVWEVIDAAKTKPFGYMPFYPGPGLGGHCIPIDPQYLAWKLKTLNYNARFIQLAEEINIGMPKYVVDKIADALNSQRKSVKGSRILVLGVSYKPNVPDLRESPALDIIHLLREKEADVVYNDPYIPSFEIDEHSMEGIDLTSEALREADCVVITANHSSYDWDWIVKESSLIMDTRNAIAQAGIVSDSVVGL